MANPTVLGEVASKTAALTTELNSLANNALVLSSVNGSSGVFANTNGAGLGGYLLGRLHLHLAALGGAAAANSAIDGWFLNAADGTNYESGSSSITPARAPDFSFPVIAQSAAQDVEIVVQLPIGSTFKILTRNNGTGQTLASSGNTVDFYATTLFLPAL